MSVDIADTPEGGFMRALDCVEFDCLFSDVELFDCADEETGVGEGFPTMSGASSVGGSFCVTVCDASVGFISLKVSVPKWRRRQHHINKTILIIEHFLVNLRCFLLWGKVHNYPNQLFKLPSLNGLI